MLDLVGLRVEVLYDRTCAHDRYNTIDIIEPMYRKYQSIARGKRDNQIFPQFFVEKQQF